MALGAGPVGAALPPPGLALHPDNPRLFRFRGVPTVLVGAGAYEGAPSSQERNVEAHLDALASQGLNYTRVFAGAAPHPEEASAGRLAAPWARSTQPGGADGGPKFDLARFDPAHFERLARFVAAAGKRDIVVKVTLFAALGDEAAWRASPFFAGNNVNGVGQIEHKKVHTLDNGPLWKHQEAFVRQTVRALAQADNVIFELVGEPWLDRPAQETFATPADAASRAWQKQVAAVILQEGPRGGRVPLIAQNVARRAVVIPEPDPNVSVFDFHEASPPAAIAMNAGVARAFGFEGAGREGGDEASLRRQAWAFLLAGGGALGPLASAAVPEARAQLGVLARFLRGFGEDLVHMRPDEGLVKGGAPSVVQVLAAAGRAYGLYLARAAGEPETPTRLALALPFGAYDVTWLDPVTGESLATSRHVHAGGLAKLEGPARSELALRLVRSAEEPGLEELPRPSVARATSPDGRTRIAVVLADFAGTPGLAAGERLYVRVERGDKGKHEVVLPWSPLGVRRLDASFVTNLTWKGARSRPVRERYKLTSGKALDVSAHGEETTVTLLGEGGNVLALDLRAYDDGVAFRYRFPEAKPGFFEVTGEDTAFRLDATARGYLLPHDEPTDWGPAYEATWKADVPAGTPAPTASGFSFPALFQVGARWVLLTESGLDGSFAASRLSPEGGLYRVRLPRAEEGSGVGAVAPRSVLPWAMPWRIVMVGDALDTIVASNLVTHLAAPSRVNDTSWIKPGRAAWSWWADSPSPKDYALMVPYIDLAARMGWEYFLVDANWGEMQNGDWKKLAAYARAKKVRLLLWYNSGGPHNRVTEAPRDLMFERQIRRAEMKTIAEAGIAGMKVDFFQSDKQSTIAQYQDILEDAAAFKLVVNFHGCTLPRGWSRTYPNLLSHEAVKGAEAYKFSRTFPDDAPVHNTILPFTRNVVGPMDYTPVTFSDSKYPHKTTNAHELALAVVFESGLQHFADSHQAYDALPEAPKAFLKEVPVAWDEVRLLGGHPGKQAVIARRKGRVWYVGGISGLPQPSTVKVPLAFVGGKARYDVTLISDGDSDRSFSARTDVRAATDALEVALRGYGGFVMRIAPQGRPAKSRSAAGGP